MSGKAKFIVLALAFLIIAAPLVSFAEYDSAKGLVPCGTSMNKEPCSLCHLYVLVQNVLDFMMWTIAPIVAVLAVGIAGFKIMISGEKPGLRADGFKIIQTTVIGLAIMFAGWVLINEALLFFTGPDKDQATGAAKILNNPWSQVTCLPSS